MITVCFHGAESTGKSVLAERLAQQPGWAWVPEFGRTYCEEHGTDLTMDDLLAIARGEAAAIAQVAAARPDLLILDTDQLMTAAWARKLFGQAPDALLTYPKADLYLLFEADVPWLEDGTRLFGSAEDRAAFAAQARQVLVDAGVPFRTIFGTWEEREAEVRACIADVIATGAA
ncbi:NadR type nicotinamide-nucleotide adenylyltransferase [Novosphingobium kunmingense]|uniref:NadR type nicotinamide-nucleotide adenylyltransferase n=1 Tax=Novosphingobium kunmingense TaxID=1211806 RepID=A0A2N0H6Q6_9SPHN|nr:ATP-binding protein [Novosphingobium kunmingense]PKB14625.1 NadR type nicotinamide-nucleotide adenylyltransferase [Novosphingobium kunmingense]